MASDRMALRLLALQLGAGVLVTLALWLALSTPYRATPLLLALLAFGCGWLAWRQGQQQLDRQGQLLRAALAGDLPAGELAALADPLVQQRLDQLAKQMRQSQHREERQALFLEAVLERLDTAVLLVAEDGALVRHNRAFRALLGQAVPASLAALPEKAHNLARFLAQAGSQDQAMLDWGEQQLKVQVSRNLIQGQALQLVTMQNIAPELEQQQQQAWLQMVQVLTHEIRNSMAPIASLAESAQALVADGELEAEDRQDLGEALATIRRRARGLAGFVDDFQQLSRLPPPKVAPLSVADWVQGVLALHREELAGLELALELAPALNVEGDRAQLEQLLINLVRNAIQALASQPKARLAIRAWRDQDSRVRLVVADNGPGVAPGALKQLFVPFFTTKVGGSGVGLSLARQIMLAHGGQIRAESPAEGGFAVSLAFPA
ncbi:ATP-binding protein [Gallaecimonas kandeliae]|uniref:sensor histidine kinase n=1 Tax=Gallaecimonas kandeliae TaxID=3029055 RepID=UPI002647EEBA|nr:ATP-binding protein [Gallaecimonas kandeliae]WKE65493.1 ATP-binding protein [Gallaecimonas kandeliae]